MTPILWFPEMIHWIFGDDNGNNLFARTAEDMAKFILPSNQLLSRNDFRKY